MPTGHLQADSDDVSTQSVVNLTEDSYESWRQLRLKQRLEESRPSAGAWNHLISVVLSSSAGQADRANLDASLRSLLQQTYRNVEVVILGTSFGEASLLESFASYRGAFLEPGLSCLDVLRKPRADRLWRGSHVIFVQAGTLFDADAFALMNAALNKEASIGSPDLLVCDYDRVSMAGECEQPSFTPGWDPDLIQCVDYIQTAFLASRSLIQRHQVESVSCSNLHDWLKLVAEQDRELAAGHLTEPVVHLPQSDAQTLPVARPIYSLPTAVPDLAVIIPNRNRPELLTQCLKFLEFENGFNTELIIVDNASDNPSLHQMYARLEVQRGAKIVSMNQRFNFARMVNLGVAAARAETFLLLNNDVEVTVPGLVEQLLVYARRPEVGVVGAKLLNGDGTVQHAGIVLEEGHAGVQTMLARHVMRGAARDNPGYLNALCCVRNYQAVTGALMVGRRDVFIDVGGFDEVHLPIEFNDVDYCLRVRRAGYRVLCLPVDGIFHRESSTRGSGLSPEVIQMRQSAMAVMAGRWREAFHRDPYQNPWAELGDVPGVRFPWSADGARKG